MRTLQGKGLDNPRKSDELTSKKIKQILTHPYIDTNSNKSLCRQVFLVLFTMQIMGWRCILS